MSIIYISGQITGSKDYKKRFKAAEDKLIKEGHCVYSPVDIAENITSLSTPLIYKKCMEADIQKLFESDTIYMLSGWEQSKGAKAEKALAESLHLTVRYEDKEEKKECNHE